MKKQRNPWIANGVLFDELDIKRWQLYMFLFAGLFMGFAMGLAVAAEAHASPPPCAMFDTCKYMPNPVDGPQMPVWDTPGTYGGWTNLPILCDPGTYKCRQVVPGN